MASNEAKLFTVVKRHMFDTMPGRVWVFRTRQAARDFARKRRARTKHYRYHVKSASWGPES